MQRISDWEKVLHEQVLAAQKKQFQWGTFDCAMFACDCVQAIAGVDPAAAYRGKYANESAAKEIIGANFLKFAHGIAMASGMDPIHRGYARRGDVVLVNNGTMLGALGIVSHRGDFAWCAAQKGLARVSSHRWLVGWKVG